MRSALAQYEEEESRRRRDELLRMGGFSPEQLTKITGWLSNTTASGGIASVANLIDAANPATQSVAGRKPTGIAANAMSFDGGDVLVWPITGTNAQTTKWGALTWVKPASVGSLQILFSTFASAASVGRIELYWAATGKIAMSVYSDGATGRNMIATANGSIANGVPAFVYWMYDSAGATDSDKCKIHVDLVDIPLTASGAGVMTTLPAVTGNHIIGGRGDADAPVAPPLNGNVLGQDFWTVNDVLTSAEEAALRAFNPLV